MGEKTETFLNSELTDDAVRCGADELAGYDDRYETAEDAARRIYKAMRRSMLESASLTSHGEVPTDLGDRPKLLEP